jgi:hypothetical protein
LIALSVGIKSPIWQLHPQVFADSPGYLVPALSLLDGRGYGVQENGFRAPTYPLLLALVLTPINRTRLSECRDAHDPNCVGEAAKTADGLSALQAIVVSQILLGVITTAVLIVLGWTLTRNTLVATLFGAGYALSLATAFWEISILTETATTFLLTLAVYLTLRADHTSRWAHLALGLVLGALALCHQLFIAYSILPFSFLLIRSRRQRLSESLFRTAPVLVLPLAFVGAWSSYNYVVNGTFTPSTLSGYVLIQMVAPVVQNAPEGYDGIVQPYVGYRDAMVAQTGSHSGAIFRAWPAMMEWTGLSWSQISTKLTTLSLYLILHYPMTYAQVVKEGWVRFWDFPLYHYDPIPAAEPSWALWLTEEPAQGGANFLFALSILFSGIMLVVRRNISRVPRSGPFSAIWFMTATVLFAAVVTSLTNFQDNARLHTYVLPLQYGSIILSVYSGWRLVSDLVGRRAENGPLTFKGMVTRARSELERRCGAQVLRP